MLNLGGDRSSSPGSWSGCIAQRVERARGLCYAAVFVSGPLAPHPDSFRPLAQTPLTGKRMQAEALGEKPGPHGIQGLQRSGYCFGVSL